MNDRKPHSVQPPLSLRKPRPKETRTEEFPVVGIGASAGGLDACKKLLAAIPAASGMAYILVQHLDPTHESLMVDLLEGHTAVAVIQAVAGLKIEPDHVYVIPPGKHISVLRGHLRLTQPPDTQGVRTSFDHLLQSLAKEYGARAVCVVLSGTGSDGSAGLKAIKDAGGFVVAQDPLDAAYDGMPKNAIATGLVDVVAPAAKLYEALASRSSSRHDREQDPVSAEADDALSEVITLLRTRTSYDFHRYKRGTLQRRMERRMVLAGGGQENRERYIERLRDDPRELDLLAKDLLINVTGFFRDPDVFGYLERKIIPDIVASKVSSEALRIWVPGCSTGEEAYSLAMVFLDCIGSSRPGTKLQVFASDIDPDALAAAREGLYPETIREQVSADRLARFFVKDVRGYRVTPDLRGTVVFSVQDVLTDPPFSRLDLVSCRNLLIYLKPEAQALVLSRVHFGLRQGGVLLLGSSESAATPLGLFEPMSPADRVFRRLGGKKTSSVEFPIASVDGVRVPPRPGQKDLLQQREALASFCQRMVLESFSPAAVLVNDKNECVFSFGRTDRYLVVAPGAPTHDLFAMARPEIRGKLRAAVHQARHQKIRVDSVVGPVAGTDRDASAVVWPVAFEGEALLFVRFEEIERRPDPATMVVGQSEQSRVAELERELKSARAELEIAIRNLEISSEEQKAINEEALSVNEEYQSTNEELLASKEELQSLNEELTALNTQLQEALELQRTTSDDLQNVLYSTNVATLFLDRHLNIRFFTPATKKLFNIIPGDVGRPLTDLRSLAADGALVEDATKVFEDLVPIEREINTHAGEWYVRRILPYRTQQNVVAGVVITFIDSTERKQIAETLDKEKKLAETANAAKSRFLAAASHDLRQPLQRLALLQDQLTKVVDTPDGQKILIKCDETLTSIAGMLNALLDINQIETGEVNPAYATFPISELFDKLSVEVSETVEARGLHFRVVPSRNWTRSDPRLLEQMLRNLLSNAQKYTQHGKILLGCRRRGNALRIEVWDTGIGIPKNELGAVFEEYRRLDNPMRERSGGLGLGLAIVLRLGHLLQHEVTVRSWPGRGSVFSIDVPYVAKQAILHNRRTSHVSYKQAKGAAKLAVLVIEDDPEIRQLLGAALKAEEWRAITAADGPSALEAAARAELKPSVVLADFSLPNGMNGLEVAKKLRDSLGQDLPVIMLTGDISSDALRQISDAKCLQINKPAKTRHIIDTIRGLLPDDVVPSGKPLGPVHPHQGAPSIYLIDDDPEIRNEFRLALEDAGRTIKTFADSEAFLEAFPPDADACLVVDAYLPGMPGIELLERLRDEGRSVPAIVITGSGDVPIAVKAMKAGAVDFLEKPIGSRELLASIDFAIQQSRDAEFSAAWRRSAAERLSRLSERQHEILHMVLAGQSSKAIAAALNLSQRTVENHRAVIFKRTGTKSLPALARLALSAERAEP